MLELQMPSLIVLLGPAAEREMAFRRELTRRLTPGGAGLARVFVPTGDEISQTIDLTRALDKVISRSSLAEAHEHSTTAGRALRLVLVGNESCGRQMESVAKMVSEATSVRSIGLVSYAVVVDLDDGIESTAEAGPSSGSGLRSLLERSTGRTALFTHVFHVSARDQKGRPVTVSAAWGQVVSFAAWVVCPVAAETIDRLLAPDAGRDFPRLGSFGLVRYVSDRESFAHSVGRDVARALRRSMGRDAAKAIEAAEAVCGSLRERLEAAWNSGESLDEVIDSALRSLARDDICRGSCVEKVLRSASSALMSLDWPAEARCRDLEGEIVKLRLEKRFMKPPRVPPPPRRGWLSVFLCWLLPFLFQPPPPPPPPPDSRADLQKRLSALEDELSAVRRQRDALRLLTAKMDDRIVRLSELLPQPGVAETPAEEQTPTALVVRNVYAWHEFQPTSDEARMDAVVQEFVHCRLPMLLDGAPLTKEATEFALQKLGDDAQPPPDTFLAACAKAVPSIVDLLLGESAPLWPADAHEIISHATIAVLPDGEDSALAPTMRQAGVTVLAVDRPEVWFISVACYGRSHLSEEVAS